MINKAAIFRINPSVSANDILSHVFQDEFLFREDGLKSNNERMIVGFTKFDEEQDFLNIQDYVGVKFKKQEKVLPKNHINEKLKQKVEQIQKNENRVVGRKEKQELKETIIQEMLPHAFIETSYINFYFDFKNHFMYIDNTSEKKYEIPLSLLLRSDLFELNPRQLFYTESFGSTMRDKLLSDWFNSDENDTLLNTSNACIIEFGADGDSSVPTIGVKNLNLLSEDVLNTLNKGDRFINSMDMTLGDEVSFKVNDKLLFSNIKNERTKRKFNPQEETIQDYNHSMLIITMDSIHNIIESLEHVLGKMVD